MIVEDWEPEIKRLEKYFSDANLSDRAYKINAFTTVLDVKKFISTGIKYARSGNGNPLFKPYLQRLQEFERYLEKTRLTES